VWCDQGLVFCIDCNAAEDPAARTCGWLAEESFYDCGNAGEDPSGANPIACEGGPTCTCEGKNCGDNGCGTSCGVCSPDKVCQAGQCVVVADGTTDGDVPNPGEDVPVVADTGRDTGSTPVDVIAPKDNAGTDTAAGTDTGTGETGEDGGGCNAGAASHSLPLFLMLSAFGAAVLRRRRG
jgi:MYXO-CTERM domain-containing protein